VEAEEETLNERASTAMRRACQSSSFVQYTHQINGIAARIVCHV
jgi:hypothetical protein